MENVITFVPLIPAAWLTWEVWNVRRGNRRAVDAAYDAGHVAGYMDGHQDGRDKQAHVDARVSDHVVCPLGCGNEVSSADIRAGREHWCATLPDDGDDHE